jgi:hypothetical protein
MLVSLVWVEEERKQEIKRELKKWKKKIVLYDKMKLDMLINY